MKNKPTKAEAEKVLNYLMQGLKPEHEVVVQIKSNAIVIEDIASILIRYNASDFIKTIEKFHDFEFAEETKYTCKKCSGFCKPSQGFGNAYQKEQHQTLVFQGKGDLIDCLKCEDCGHSFIPIKQEIQTLKNHIAQLETQNKQLRNAARPYFNSLAFTHDAEFNKIDKPRTFEDDSIEEVRAAFEKKPCRSKKGCVNCDCDILEIEKQKNDESKFYDDNIDEYQEMCDDPLF